MRASRKVPGAPGVGAILRCAWRTGLLSGKVCLALVALAGAGAATHATAADFLKGPAPSWVAPQSLDLDASAPPGQVAQGVHYLVVDQQTLLGTGSTTTYHRLASRAVNEHGVDGVSQISIDFDPTYQKLTLHTLNIHRAGKTYDRLGSTPIRELQREVDLESRIYDGSRTIHIVLEDVRADDVVEYAYSVSGTNPVFGGRHSGRMTMQWYVPVHHLHRRLRVPAGREVRILPHRTGLQPRVSSRDGWAEYDWSATDVAPVPYEDDLPSWYEPQGSVEWSTFRDWGAVARWAEPLFATGGRSGPLVQAEVDRIGAATALPEQRLLAVLAFVQSQIRYLAIELGPGSQAPRAPEAVLAHRYGDCKDKVLLAVALLEALGIEAHPALVNTRLRQSTADELPMPGAFDHSILLARIQGRDYWLDPTRFPQKGSLDRIAQADFGQALVLDGRSTALTAMPAASVPRYRRAIAVRIDASRGYGSPAPLEVTSTFEGTSADRLCNTLRNENREDLERSYLNYYLRAYPGLERTAALTVDDDEAANRLVMVEHYRVASLLSKDVRDGKPYVYLRAPDIKDALHRPADVVRTAPLAVRHPLDLDVTVTALLPEGESAAPSRFAMRDPAFEFTAVDTFQDRTLRLAYHYRSLSDHVDPKGVLAYDAAIEAARENVGYTIWTGAHVRHTRGLIALVVLLVLAALMVLALVATIVVQLGARRDSVAEAGRRSDMLLLGVGAYLAISTPFLSFATVLAVRQVLGVGATFGWGAVTCTLLLYFSWYAAVQGPWLKWATARARDPVRFLARARRLRLLPLRAYWAQRGSNAKSNTPPG